MFFLDRLQREAEAAGGRVHVINGNHETLNVHGRFRYASTAGLLDYETWRKMQLFGSAMKVRALFSYRRGRNGVSDCILELATLQNAPTSSQNLCDHHGHSLRL